MKYGVNGETPEICRAALRCVANALLLDPRMRQVLVDTGFGGKLAEKLKVHHFRKYCGLPLITKHGNIGRQLRGRDGCESDTVFVNL